MHTALCLIGKSREILLENDMKRDDHLMSAHRCVTLFIGTEGKGQLTCESHRTCFVILSDGTGEKEDKRGGQRAEGLCLHSRMRSQMHAHCSLHIENLNTSN